MFRDIYGLFSTILRRNVIFFISNTAILEGFVENHHIRGNGCLKGFSVELHFPFILDLENDYFPYT